MFLSDLSDGQDRDGIGGSTPRYQFKRERVWGCTKVFIEHGSKMEHLLRTVEGTLYNSKEIDGHVVAEGAYIDKKCATCQRERDFHKMNRRNS